MMLENRPVSIQFIFVLASSSIPFALHFSDYIHTSADARQSEFPDALVSGNYPIIFSSFSGTCNSPSRQFPAVCGSVRPHYRFTSLLKTLHCFFTGIVPDASHKASYKVLNFVFVCMQKTIRHRAIIVCNEGRRLLVCAWRF